MFFFIGQLAPGAHKICQQRARIAASWKKIAGEINSYRPAIRGRSAGENGPGPPDIGSENHDFKR